jgi:elongation of very long chain fatty acids protein 6
MSCQLKDLATCTYQTSDGAEYQEFACIYKFLEPFYLEVEKCFDSVRVLKWTAENPWLPAVAVTLYAISIYWGNQAMQKREPFQWRMSMALWNLFLSIFSFGCMIRVTPHLLHNIAVGEPRDLLCISPEVTYGYGSTGLWVTLFMWSKFAELLDTFFIVIHKKPLIFLHWWHHITVLLYSWYAYVTRTPSSIIFMAVNSSVHAMMYGYYFLMTVKMKPKWMNPVFITLAQLVQMVVGIIITGLSTYYHFTATEERPCAIERSTLVPCFAMYGSYFILFLQFFLKRYFFKGSSSGKQRTATKKVL